MEIAGRHPSEETRSGEGAARSRAEARWRQVWQESSPREYSLARVVAAGHRCWGSGFVSLGWAIATKAKRAYRHLILKTAAACIRIPGLDQRFQITIPAAASREAKGHGLKGLKRPSGATVKMLGE